MSGWSIIVDTRLLMGNDNVKPPDFSRAIIVDTRLLMGNDNNTRLLMGNDNFLIPVLFFDG